MFLELICGFFDFFTIYIYFNEMLGPLQCKIKKWIYISTLILIQFGLYAISLLYKNNFSSTGSLINALSHFILLFAFTFLHNCKISRRLFTTLSLQVFASISEMIVYITFVLLPQEVSAHLFENDVYGSIASRIVTFMLISITILIRKRKQRNYPASYTLLILVTPITTIILLITTPGLSTITHTQAIVSLFGMAGILITNIANYFLLNNIIKVNELKQTTAQLNQQLEYQSDKYQLISAAYRDSRSLIHDMKKHYFFIKDCVENQHYDQILSYLKTSLDAIEGSYIRVNTGNLVIDAFVSNHMALAQQENIEFTTDINLIKEKIEVDDFDLCIILGNLLDNAMEACRAIKSPSPRQIMVQIFTLKDEFVIHIHNTMTGSQPATKSELVHGFGTQNVETVTLSYYGNYTHKIEKGRYHAMVSIPILDDDLRY